MRALLLCGALLAVGCLSAEEEVVVRIKSGEIRGKQAEADGQPLTVFLGIPYAEPPIGELRFRRPRPVGPWTQPREAKAFSSACHQNGRMFEIEDYLENKSFSEDCLYLNVWSPKGSEDSPKAVMVWIHGGGLLVGSASEHYYRGDILATKGDVVVVSMNYRLNALGFLYSGEESAPGNVGLWDQALALEWINDNIRYFGGDAEKITIFGESAGSWSVSLHILSPASRHLFHNAIMNSGAYLYNYAEDAPEDHVSRWLKGAELVGCGGASFSAETMRCLRSVSAEKLVNLTDNTDLMVGSVKVFNLVVVDGEFVPRKPREMLTNGDFKRDVNLMVSTVEDEGSFLLTWLTDPEKFHPTRPQVFSLPEARRELAAISDDLCSAKRVSGEDVSRVYYSRLSAANSADELRRVMGVAVGDYYLSCPTLEFAKRVYKGSGYKARVFQYYFNAKLATNFFCSQWMGVCHTNDIFPMLGIPFLDRDEYCDREREISAQMMAFLTHFAKTGSPSPDWSPYFRVSGDHVIAPYLEIRSERNETAFRLGLKINECERLWNRYLL